MDLLAQKWTWYWRADESKADCGIFAEPRPGHAYSVARCPQYASEEQWSEIAAHICDLHNERVK